MNKFYIISILILLLLQGCVYFHEDGNGNHRFGVSTHKYRDCVEYYDAAGIYHRDCNEDLINYGFVPSLQITIEGK